MKQTLSLENPKFIYDYLTCIIPKSIAVPIQRLILHWSKHKGVEWTVERLKNLKTQRIHFENGSEVILVASHKDTTPKGCFRSLWGIDLVKAMRVLNIYTSVLLPQVTKKQSSKFHNAVNQREWSLSLPLRTDGIVIQKKYYHPSPYAWIRAGSKNAPFITSARKISSKPEMELTFDDVIDNAFSFYSNADHVLLHSKEYAKAFWIHDRTLRKACWDTETAVLVHKEGSDPKMWSKVLVGRIGYIQERGAKLRAIANPLRHFQMVLTPLALALDDLLQSMPWSCVHDQESGVKFCQEGLVAGKVINSIDLSNATDSFPLKVQLEVVRSILVRSLTVSQRDDEFLRGYTDQQPADLLEELSIFGKLARGQWYDRYGEGKPYLTWGKGQPLGMVPSFAIFTLTHGILIRNIEMKLGKSNTFRVLGDDVVINDSDVARIYVEELEYMGCEISALKSISSSHIAEFAGKVITADGSVPVEKWKPFSWANPLGPLVTLGNKGLRFVPKSVRKRVAILAAAPEPVGLGYNPKGLDWDSRVPQVIQHWWWPTEHSIPSNEKLSYEDAERHHSGFWKRTLRRVVLFSLNRDEDPKIGEDLIPYPHDSEGAGYSDLFIDHVRAINKACLYPGDPIIHIRTKPSPNRGRFDINSKVALRGGNGRMSQYIRECRKIIKMNKDD
jgi:hypothetical protein